MIMINQMNIEQHKLFEKTKKKLSTDVSYVKILSKLFNFMQKMHNLCETHISKIYTKITSMQQAVDNYRFEDLKDFFECRDFFL